MASFAAPPFPTSTPNPSLTALEHKPSRTLVTNNPEDIHFSKNSEQVEITKGISIDTKSTPKPIKPLRVSRPSSSSTLSSKLVALSKGNKVQQAVSTYHQMEDNGVIPTLHAYNSLIASLIRNGHTRDALRVFRDMKKGTWVSPSGHTLSIVARAIADFGGWEAVMNMYDEMESDYGLEMDVIGWNSLISVCGRAKRWDEVYGLWAKMKENGCRETLVTFSLLLSTFVRSHKVNMALEAYSHCVGLGFKPTPDMLKGLTCVCSKTGNWKLGLYFFRQMVHSNISPNLTTYNILIHCLSKSEKINLALRVYDHMGTTGVVPDAYTIHGLLVGLNREKLFEKSLGIFEKFRASGVCKLDCRVYNEALVACERLGVWERALQYVWDMEKCGVKPQFMSYNLLLRTCKVAKQPMVALQVYEHMLQVNCGAGVSADLSFIRYFGRELVGPDLEHLIQKICTSDLELNPLIYDTLIQTLCSHEKVETAKRLYERMIEHECQPSLKTEYLMKAL